MGHKPEMPPLLARSVPLKHGPIACTACFPAGFTPGGTYERDGWRVDNNPGYSGATSPEILVLGFSKGANQRGAIPFDRIAFNKARGNLKEVLVALGLLDSQSEIDRCFTSAETRIGFASVVRCGLGKRDDKGKYVTSGPVVRSAIAHDSPARQFFDACTERFLGSLPESVRTVVFLGLDRTYVEAVFERMKQLHPSINRVSELAYRTDFVTFIHVIHPSPLATSHRQAWLRNEESSLANKRREVCVALRELSAAPLKRAVALPAHFNMDSHGAHKDLATEMSSTRAKREGRSLSRPMSIEPRIDGDTAYVPIGEANLKNDHFYLRKIIRFFPKSAIGGSDKTQCAAELLTVNYMPGDSVMTDIAGPDRLGGQPGKFIFRDRASIKKFFARSAAEPGDEVVIRRDGACVYTVRLQKRSS